MTVRIRCAEPPRGENRVAASTRSAITPIIALTRRGSAAHAAAARTRLLDLLEDDRAHDRSTVEQVNAVGLARPVAQAPAVYQRGRAASVEVDRVAHSKPAEGV